MRHRARSWAFWFCAATVAAICAQAAQAGSRFATSSTTRVEEAVHLDFTIRIPALIFVETARSPTQVLVLTPATQQTAERTSDERFSASTNAGTLAFAPTDMAASRGNGQDAPSESPLPRIDRAYVVAAP